MERRRIFSFGKIDYCGRGRKINEVCLEIEVRDWNGYPEFTASADVWDMEYAPYRHNRRRTNDRRFIQ